MPPGSFLSPLPLSFSPRKRSYLHRGHLLPQPGATGVIGLSNQGFVKFCQPVNLLRCLHFQEPTGAFARKSIHRSGLRFMNYGPSFFLAKGGLLPSPPQPSTTPVLELLHIQHVAKGSNLLISLLGHLKQLMAIGDGMGPGDHLQEKSSDSVPFPSRHPLPTAPRSDLFSSEDSPGFQHRGKGARENTGNAGVHVSAIRGDQEPRWKRERG